MCQNIIHLYIKDIIMMKKQNYIIVIQDIIVQKWDVFYKYLM